MKPSVNFGRFRQGHKTWNKGLKGFQRAWNKGLTKDTDVRVGKISVSLLGRPHLWTRSSTFVGPNKGRRWSVSYREKMSRVLKRSRKIYPIWNKGLTKKTHPSLLKMAGNLSLALKGVPRPFVSSKQGTRRFWFYGLDRRIKMRSRWEVAYAHWLEAHGISWAYEPVTFVAHRFSYTPDFYIFGKELFVELKGWENSLWDEKISALRSRWGCRLEVLDGKALQNLGILDEHNRAITKERRAS